MMMDNSYIQVHEGGIRHLQQQKRVNEWRVPQGRRITAAASNQKQICIALTGGDLVSFEIDESHLLCEVHRKTLGFEATSLSVQPIPAGRSRAQFVAINGLDNTVRILSLDKEKELAQMSVQLLPNNAHAESCSFLYIETKNPAGSPIISLYLFVGLETGVLLRASVDLVTGELSDQRTRFLGPKGIKLHAINLGAIGEGTVGCGAALIALSTKPWLCYSAQKRVECIPLYYDALEYVNSFSSEQCPNGFVAISGRSLRIFQICGIGESFTQTTIPLSYTPRKMCVLPPAAAQMDFMMSATSGPVTAPVPPQHVVLAIIEADHNAYDDATKVEIAAALGKIKLNRTEGDDEESDDMQEEGKEEEETEAPPLESQVGTFRAGPGKWGSCIRVVYPAGSRTIFKKSLDVDEAALSCTVCRFWEFDSPCLIVGTAYNLVYRPRSCPQASIKVFAYNSEYKLSLLHSTPLDGQPLALCPWDGRLIVAVGRSVRIYSLGRKKLLRKCEYKTMPEAVVWLRVIGDRIYAGDIREGFHVLKYKAADNSLRVLADETRPNWVTCGEVLDYNTVAGGDKFDSFVVARVPEEVGKSSGHLSAKLQFKTDVSQFAGDNPKFEHISQYHIGETITAIQKATLIPGGTESIVYSTIMGSIGCFLPLLTKDEVDLLQHLEMSLRSIAPPLAGRDHMVYRSYYAPLKSVIDGDFCEQFKHLPPAKQQEVADEVDRTKQEILRKLEELRNRVL